MIPRIIPGDLPLQSASNLELGTEQLGRYATADSCIAHTGLRLGWSWRQRGDHEVCQGGSEGTEKLGILGPKGCREAALDRPSTESQRTGRPGTTAERLAHPGDLVK